jgi:RraA family protein
MNRWVHNDPLRVLLITEAAGGGSGRHVLDLAEGLLERGHDVHLIYAPGRLDRFFSERLEGDRARNVNRSCLAIRRGLHPADFAAVGSIRRYIRDHGPFDVIHGHSAKGGALARLAALGAGTPVFYTLHGYVAMDPGLPWPKRLFYQSLEWVLSQATDRIIAVSPEERRLCLRHGLGQARVALIPNGVTPMALPPRPVARRALGLADDWLIAGFVGRLVSQKAPEVLIQALAEAAAPSPSAERLRLVLVGSGPLEEELRRLAEGLGVADRIVWLGERSSRDVLPAFDLFVLPSRKEGLPYVVLEAMSAGLPVLATSAAGVEVLVRHGRNGLVVPPGRPDRLAAGLVELVSDLPRLRDLGHNARRRAAQFSVAEMVDRTIAEYRSCLEHAGADPHRRTQLGTPRTEIPSWPWDIPVKPATSLPAQTEHHHQQHHQHHQHQRGGYAMVSKPRSAEMHPGPGFRVRLDIPRPEAALIASFQKFATPDISDLLNRLYAIDPGIRCLTGPHHRLCGPACTVKVFPGDNLMVHKALDVARPGDVVVVDAGNSTRNAVLGDLISAKARHRRIAGFVVDGLIRDLPSIEPLDFPVFARGTTPVGPLHRGPGEINYPICCGGVVVNPGDLIVADAAGAIVVPREITAEVLERLELHEETNQAYFEAVRRGEFSNQWVDRLLAEQNCPILGVDDRHNGNGSANGTGNGNGKGHPSVVDLAPATEVR